MGEPGGETCLADESVAEYRVVGQVPGIPYSWDDSFQLASKDIQGVMNGYTTVWDFTYSFVK